VRRIETVRLDTHFVARRVEVLGVKQWWLARMVGVDRKTVGRWLSGRVKRIAHRNAEKLAAHLECSLADITAPDGVDVYATREEQRAAAALLREKDLLQILSPSDNWDLAERVIKATMHPDLPLRDIGQLYNLLSIAAWRQGNYVEGAAHAERARELGEKLDDAGIILNAAQNLATIDSLLGRNVRALEGYEKCLARPEYFHTKRDHAKALSNVAMVYRDFARFGEGVAAQAKAIKLFEEPVLPFNLAIAWTGMGDVLTEIGCFSEARAAAGKARRYAAEAGFEKGLVTTLFYLGDVACLQGDLGEARRLVEAGTEGLGKYEVYDLACHEIAARFYRRAGELDEAARRATYGLSVAEGFPTLRAGMLQERARLATAEGNPAGEVRYRGEANAIFEGTGLGARVRAEPVVEYGEMFPVDRGTRAALEPFFRKYLKNG
jgi:tetratricopeptide (TPR) repeat protein